MANGAAEMLLETKGELLCASRVDTGDGNPHGSSKYLEKYEFKEPLQGDDTSMSPWQWRACRRYRGPQGDAMERCRVDRTGSTTGSARPTGHPPTGLRR